MSDGNLIIQFYLHFPPTKSINKCSWAPETRRGRSADQDPEPERRAQYKVQAWEVPIVEVVFKI